MKLEHRTVGPFAENCYLVIDDGARRCVIVDPGDEGERLIQMVRGSGATLDAIWLTHAHIDHVGAVNAVCAAFDVPVFLHPLDLPYYERLSASAAQMYGLPFDQPSAETTPLADGQILVCGALRFTVQHVPGHAAGHVSFTGEGVALSGDLLFAGSIGRTDLPLSNPFDMEESLARFITLPGETRVYPGHGDSTTIAAERATNPFLSGRARMVKR